MGWVDCGWCPRVSTGCWEQCEKRMGRREDWVEGNLISWMPQPPPKRPVHIEDAINRFLATSKLHLVDEWDNWKPGRDVA